MSCISSCTNSFISDIKNISPSAKKWILIACSIVGVALISIGITSCISSVPNLNQISIPLIGSGILVCALALTYVKTQNLKKPSISITPAASQPKNPTPKKELPTANVDINITTANLGLLPASIHRIQSVWYKIKTIFSKEPVMLLSADKRINRIAKNLASSNSSIICCQEVFDKQARLSLTKTLSNKGYTVIQGAGTKQAATGSGLLVASRYPVVEEGVKFWKFKASKGVDRFAAKGLLKVPLQACINDENIDIIHLYTTHLQAGVNGTSVRKQQLNFILNTLEEDQKQYPDALILLAGDLNITNIESDGVKTNKYSLHTSFFSKFFDPYFYDHDANGIRSQGEPYLLEADVNTFNLGNNIEEPTGSFYDMQASNPLTVCNNCRYDYCLIFKGNKTLENDVMHSEIRHVMHPRLSDHLPLTTIFNLPKYTDSLYPDLNT